MSPLVIFFIFFTTGCPCAQVSTHFTKPRPYTNRMRNDTFDVKSNPVTKNINYYNIRPYNFDPLKPEHKETGYTRRQRNEVNSYTSRMYRSYGRGKAEIPYMGATVSVLNAVTYPKVKKETIKNGTIDSREEGAKLVSGANPKCRSCPRSRKVIASKGNAHVLLPQPCPYLKWYSLAGPKPGSLLKEGHYTLIGRVGLRGKLCQYKYQVLVRRCGALNVTSGQVTCTAEDVWGSKCEFTCDSGHELEGPESSVCGYDQNWSNEPPVCKRRISCSYPQTPDNGQVSCKVPEGKEQVDDLLPRGTQCIYKLRGTKINLKCEDGYWIRMKPRGRKNKMGRIRKHRN